MELSKAFDVIIHNLLLTKLHAYDFSFSITALNLVCVENRNGKTT